MSDMAVKQDVMEHDAESNENNNANVKEVL
jgi:hypothetical protein